MNLSTRTVESIYLRFLKDIANNNSPSSKEVSVPHQIVHVSIIVEKNNDLPKKDQNQEQPLVDQKIHVK